MASASCGRPVDSLLAQTFSDFEFVIADNCSTDGTEAICRDYVARDPRVRYFRNERNIGGPANFRRSFELCTGEYHKWSTADDYWAPTMIEKGVALLDANPELVLAFPRTKVVDAEGHLIRDFDDHLDLMQDLPSVRFRRVLDTTSLCHAQLGVLRRSVMLKTQLIGSELASDIRFLAEMSLYGNSPSFQSTCSSGVFIRTHRAGSVRTWSASVPTTPRGATGPSACTPGAASAGSPLRS
jgi:glycosyltransferase involved in cell wall biosynthesis